MEKRLAPALMNIDQVSEYLGIGKTKIKGLVSARKFPAPKKIDRCSRWRRSDLDEWIEKLE